MPTRRVSVTKLQRESLAAVELFAIAESLTADGRLSPAELAPLRDWTVRHRDAPLPAREHLTEILAQIEADGVVTSAELDELHRALEKVLPPDLRSGAVERRKSADAAEASRDRMLEHWNFMVAGSHVGDRADAALRAASGSGDVTLIREPSNPYSAAAVQVVAENGEMLGYVPDRDARAMAPRLDAGSPYVAYLTKVLSGGRRPIAVVQVELFGADAQVEGLRRTAQGGGGARARRRWPLAPVRLRVDAPRARGRPPRRTRPELSRPPQVRHRFGRLPAGLARVNCAP
jgi:hypothetical protein